MLELAVQNNCNFVILPEYAISPKLLDTIKNYLYQNSARIRASGLIAVFAGSTYENGNNVLHILHYTGREIGQYYKYSPFRKESEDAKDSYVSYEYLKNPGKECTLLDIPFIGRILPAICRDMIDGAYTEKLVRRFLPLAVFAPAYSPSVEAFEAQLQSYGNEYHASTVLCNHCASTKDKTENENIGLAGIPRKNKTKMAAYTPKIKRNRYCIEQCGRFDCGFFLDMQYGGIDGTASPNIQIRFSRPLQ